MLLDIRAGPEYNPTRKAMQEFVTSGEAMDFVPDGATYAASGSGTLEKQTGYWLQTAIPLKRTGMRMYQDALMYQIRRLQRRTHHHAFIDPAIAHQREDE